jgi:hypothetical protein
MDCLCKRPMMVYKLEKWYFDLLTPDQDFIFFYFTRVKLFSYSDERFYLNIISPKFKPTFHASLNLKPNRNNSGPDQKLIQSEWGSIELNKSDCSIRLDLIPTAILLNYKFIDFSRVTTSLYIRKDPRHMISWKPIATTATISGSISTPSLDLNLQNASGYIDYVTSTIFPFQVPVRELFWGRIHHPDHSISFTAAFAAGSHRDWSKLFMTLVNEHYEMDDLQITVDRWSYSDALGIKYPAVYQISGGTGGVRIDISVENDRVLIESPFIDQNDISNPIQFKLYQAISLNPRGIKFLSRIDLRIDIHGRQKEVKDLRAVTEYVRFGHGASG